MSPSETTLRDLQIPAPVIDVPDDYLHAEQTLSSWFFTTDHKRIGILYLVSITLFFVLGSLAAGLVRLALVVPDGEILTNDVYNRMFTLHGVIMVWFFLVPSIPNTLGNFLLPLMIGAKDVAFPRLNLLSWYIFVLGSLFTVLDMLWGGVDTGWTFYTPLSTQYSNSYVIAAVLGVIVVGFSSILTGLNFMVTTHKLRAPGMTWFRLPLFVWGLYATSLILVMATPVLTIVLVLLFVDRAFGLSVFDPVNGGDPVMFQHLFWFYSHPVVYVMVLPGMGVMSELVTAFLYKKDIRLQVHCIFKCRHRGDRLFRVGPPHVLQRDERVCGPDILVHELYRGGALGHQGVQIGPPRSTKARSGWTRPCCSRWVGSACS